MAECMLSIKTNPFDYFTSFNEWYAYDDAMSRALGRCNTLQLLAKHARCSNYLSDQRNDEEIDRAIDEIVANDPLRIYVKAYKKEQKTTKNVKAQTNELASV